MTHRHRNSRRMPADIVPGAWPSDTADPTARSAHPTATCPEGMPSTSSGRPPRRGPPETRTSGGPSLLSPFPTLNTVTDYFSFPERPRWSGPYRPAVYENGAQPSHPFAGQWDSPTTYHPARLYYPYLNSGNQAVQNLFATPGAPTDSDANTDEEIPPLEDLEHLPSGPSAPVPSQKCPIPGCDCNKGPLGPAHYVYDPSAYPPGGRPPTPVPHIVDSRPAAANDYATSNEVATQTPEYFPANGVWKENHDSSKYRGVDNHQQVGAPQGPPMFPPMTNDEATARVQRIAQGMRGMSLSSSAPPDRVTLSGALQITERWIRGKKQTSVFPRRPNDALRDFVNRWGSYEANTPERLSGPVGPEPQWADIPRGVPFNPAQPPTSSSSSSSKKEKAKEKQESDDLLGHDIQRQQTLANDRSQDAQAENDKKTLASISQGHNKPGATQPGRASTPQPTKPASPAIENKKAPSASHPNRTPPTASTPPNTPRPSTTPACPPSPRKPNASRSRKGRPTKQDPTTTSTCTSPSFRVHTRSPSPLSSSTSRSRTTAPRPRRDRVYTLTKQGTHPPLSRSRSPSPIPPARTRADEVRRSVQRVEFVPRESGVRIGIMRDGGYEEGEGVGASGLGLGLEDVPLSPVRGTKGEVDGFVEVAGSEGEEWEVVDGA